jgi:hypothetical protein
MKTFMAIVKKWRDAPDLTKDEKVAFIRAELDALDDKGMATREVAESMVMHVN